MSRAIHKLRGRREYFFNVGDSVFDATTTNNPDSAAAKPAGLSCPNPRPGRMLIGQFNARDNYADTSFSMVSCNIGGVPAASIYQYDYGGGSHSTLSYWWYVSDEVSASVHMTGVLSGFGANMNTWTYTLYELVGYSMTPVATAGESASSNVTINTSGSDLVLLGAGDEGASAGSWTGGGNPTGAYTSDGNHASGYDDQPTGASTNYSYSNFNHHHAAIALRKL